MTSKDPPPPPMRSKAPSLHDIVSELTGSHDVDSEPPAMRWLDRRIGRAVRLATRWLIRTKGGTAVMMSIAAFLTWLSHKITHWMGP
jgi:hypothetical protein